MKIGCFACVEPFAPMARQFAAIREMGFAYADVTDNHDGAALGDPSGDSPGRWLPMLALTSTR